MATITASLERSLQNCSLNRTRNRRGGGATTRRSSSPPDLHHHHHHIINDNYNNHDDDHHDGGNYESAVTQSNASSSDDNSTFVELNSHVSLPYHWEQCLDLKTGEIYYINWSNGMKAKQDPRTTATGYNGDYYSEEEDENDDDNDEDEDEDEQEEESYTYDSEGSSTESNSARSSNNNFRSVKKLLTRKRYQHQQQQQQQQQHEQLSQDSVLVVAGCKSCLMYHMVPRHVVECPKCSGQLLHFGANNSPSLPSSSSPSPSP